MKLQAASRREVTRIAIGTLVCDAIMIAGLFLLSQFEIGTFHLGKIILGTACGSAIAILNFIILCLTIQSALTIENKRKMKARFQFSYNTRLAIQAGWIVAAFLLRRRMHFIAAAAPVFFPQISLVYLQLTGRLVTNAPAKTEPAQEPPANTESN